jgi:hypothetical protein
MKPTFLSPMSRFRGRGDGLHLPDPEELRGRVAEGHRVPVPLGRRRTHGYVIRVHEGPLESGSAPRGPEPEERSSRPTFWPSAAGCPTHYLAPLGEVSRRPAPGRYGPRARRRSGVAVFPKPRRRRTRGRSSRRPRWNTSSRKPSMRSRPPWRGAVGVHLRRAFRGREDRDLSRLAHEVLRSGGSVLG